MFELADLLKLAENNRIKIETCRLPFGINSIYTELKECPAIICLEQSLSAPQIKIELALCLGYYFLRVKSSSQRKKNGAGPKNGRIPSLRQLKYSRRRSPREPRILRG